LQTCRGIVKGQRGDRARGDRKKKEAWGGSEKTSRPRADKAVDGKKRKQTPGGERQEYDDETTGKKTEKRGGNDRAARTETPPEGTTPTNLPVYGSPEAGGEGAYLKNWGKNLPPGGKNPTKPPIARERKLQKRGVRAHNRRAQFGGSGGGGYAPSGDPGVKYQTEDCYEGKKRQSKQEVLTRHVPRKKGVTVDGKLKTPVKRPKRQHTPPMKEQGV